MERNFRLQKKSIKRRRIEPQLSRSLELKVVCNGAMGISNSVVLASDSEMYLFNCGELTHRTLVDNRFSGSIQNIFFTYNSWRNTGGLMGFLMSKMRTVHREEVTQLYGPEHVGTSLKLVKFFESSSAALAQTVRMGLPEEGYEDSQVSIEFIQLHPDPPGTNIAVVYIIKPKSRPYRKVDVEKLMSLGVDSGPWVGELVRGNRVTLDSGLVVRPEDVLEDEYFPRPIIIVECPSIDHLGPLMISERLVKISGETGDGYPQLVVHMSPEEVVKDARYKTFIDRFTSPTQHLMMNNACPGPVLREAYQLTRILHQVHSGIFPLLQSPIQHLEPENQGTQPTTSAHTGLCYQLKPHSGFKQLAVSYNRSIESHGLEMSRIDDKKEVYLTKKPTSHLKDNYPEVVFLGTGSTLPLGTRGSSAILVQMRKDEYLLLDCGEGTLSQLYQLYGPEVSHILKNLKAVFISHLHYDHHGGLQSLLEGREKVYVSTQSPVPPVTLLAPQMLQRWLRNYSQHLQHVPVRLIPHHFMYECFSTDCENEQWNELNTHLNVKQYIPVPVNHVSNSHGLVLTHQDGWKLVYSGDTMPCPLLIDKGRDCNLLIHEATFTDDSEKLAATKKHSTISQAVSVGHQMGAQFTLLTHFSQHVTQDIVKLTEYITDDVGIAFDFMTVRPSNLKDIPMLKPILNQVFSDVCQEQKKLHLGNFSSFDHGLLEARGDRMNNAQAGSIGSKSNQRTQSLIDRLASVTQKSS